MTASFFDPMRQWTLPHNNSPVQVLGDLIGLIGQDDFEFSLLAYLQAVVPAASYSIYQTGSGCAPQLFMSASLGVPDTTRDCWKAYLSGPYRNDRTFAAGSAKQGHTQLCHITAQEVPALHRARVYEAHGMVERVSAVEQSESSIFAINFYRHAHQAAFSDAHLCGFEALAPALITLAKKQIALSTCHKKTGENDIKRWLRKLQQLDQNLTARELDVCARLLVGMTQDGIASDLNLSVPTVKTYRNRAFARMGIHFRNELFARVAGS
jgi:DNA-binding CsgD family transcriptional regulator